MFQQRVHAKMISVFKHCVRGAVPGAYVIGVPHVAHHHMVCTPLHWGLRPMCPPH